MNIFFDCQAFELPYGGVSRYFCELISGINSEKLHHAHLSLLWSNNIHLREYNLFDRSYPSKKHRLFNKINRLYNCIDAKSHRYDICHTTYFDDFVVPYAKPASFITTFHDMTYERLSHRFAELSDDKWIIPQKRKVAQQASHLIAVSNSTKQDMIELLGIPSEKITVIHLSSPFAPDSVQLESESNEADPPYLLYVGKRYEYKNFIAFLRAVAPILIRYQIGLVCAGGGSFTKNEKNIIQELSLGKLIEYREINDDTLKGLYKGAVAFVFPSLYEGFGIPVLEAFACDCPCIVSDTSSLPEVAGEAALYIDPANSESMAHAVETVILSGETRTKLIEYGRQQLSQFSWQRTVNETINVYNKLM